MVMRFIDLFCGIGSFHESFKKYGWTCVLASDIDPSVRDVYEENHGIAPVGDIYAVKSEDVPEHDVLCAGFPCQAFSNAGKKKGFDDERGVLFYEIMRIARHRRPKVMLLENVPGLKNHDGGNTLDTILKNIKDAEYEVCHKILKCSDYGIPQMRKRLLMFCVRKDLVKENFDPFDLKHFEKDVSMKEYLNKNFEKRHAYTIRCGGQRSPIGGKHNWDGYIVDGEEYRLTLDDAKALQGFNKNFKLAAKNKDAWRHLGNTIPTIFTSMMASKVNELLMSNSYDERK